MRQLLVPLFAIGLLIGCKGKSADIGTVSAYTPVYLSKTEAEKITQMPPQPIVNGGKIATLGNYVFQVEEDKGIHIINYANPASPVKIGFIKVPLCRELTLKGNYIYTNNMADLVVIDLNNPSNIAVTARIANAFPDLSIQYPSVAGAFFECPDASKGLVIAWELKQVNNPKCKRP